MTIRRLGDASVRRGLRLIFRMLFRYRREAVASVAFALGWMVMTVAGPFLQKVVIDRAIVAERRDLLAPLVGAVLAVGAGRALGIAGRRYFAFRVSYRAETDLRNRIFEHIQRLTFSYHDRTATGELMARASSDLSQVRLIYAMLPITVANVVMFGVVGGLLIALDPVLGVVALAAIPALLGLAVVYARAVLNTSFEVQQRLADMATVVQEGVGGIRVTKAFGRELAEVARVEAVADGIFAKTMQLIGKRAAYVPIFELIPSAAAVAVLWIGGLRVIDGAMSLGDFVAFSQYMVILVFPLRITGFFFAELPRAAAAASRVVELLRTAPDIVDVPDAGPMPPGNGEVRFCHVGFSYPGGPPVLEDVDLRIPAGTAVAVVGSTGSGKTTLAYLIPRFYDPTEGQVLIDGVDVRKIRLEELRSAVAVVFEEPFLFSATIRDNIAFGDPEAGDDQVRLAARLAQAHDFIVDLPDGYDTMVGERGLSLSGGQRQRIALARAMLRDPRVLILDDATSSVDAVTEAEIRDALRTVMAGRTTIIVAHRVSTLALAERVVLIDEGRVVATGTHEELLANVPRYAEVLAEVSPGEEVTSP